MKYSHNNQPVCVRSEVWSNQFKHQVNMVLPELRSFKLFKLISSAWDRSDYKMIRLGKIWQRNRQKGVNWVLVTAHRDQALIGSWNVYFLSDLSDMWGKLEFISLQNTAYIWSENKTSNYWEGRTEDQLSCLCLVPEYKRNTSTAFSSKSVFFVSLIIIYVNILYRIL